MNIVLLGTCTDDKRFFILCLAKILQAYKKVGIYTCRPYSFEDGIGQVYDCCGIEIHHLFNDGAFKEAVSIDEETIKLFDLEEYIPVETEKLVAICDASRMCLEQSIKLVRQFLEGRQSKEFQVVFLNLMEYCKVGEKYMSLFWERSLPDASISQIYPVYFEEVNRILMIENQYFEKLPIRDLTRSYKAVLLKLLSNLLSLDVKQVKRLMKQAERMK